MIDPAKQLAQGHPPISSPCPVCSTPRYITNYYPPSVTTQTVRFLHFGRHERVIHRQREHTDLVCGHCGYEEEITGPKPVTE